MRIVDSLLEPITKCPCGLIIAHKSQDNKKTVMCPKCKQPLTLEGTSLLTAHIVPIKDPIIPLSRRITHKK